jgi:hypothetical protein
VLYYTFTDGVAKTVNLKAGEKLVFITLPVGTGWTAVDTLGSATPFSSYTATGSVNGSAITGGGTAGVSLSTGSQIVSATASNLAAFINDYTSQPLTGIIINNLPYILLVLLAIAILAAYVVGRSRRRRYDAE